MGKRLYNFNQSYFDLIDSNEKAYWLGFIYAEGNVYKNTFGLKLGGEDKYVLDQFKKDIDTDYKINKVKNKNAYVIKIHSKAFIQQLAKLGIFPNKNSKITQPPIEKKYWAAFILGFYDGDGWISRRGNSWTVGFASRSKYIIKFIVNAFKDFGCGSGCLIKRTVKERPFYQLCYHGEIAKLTLDLIYVCKFSIVRKFKAYQEFKNCIKIKYQQRTSKYKGVCLDAKYNKWKSYVQHRGKKIILGFFDHEIDAAKKYNNFVKKHPDIPQCKINIFKEVV